jgi:hypothetical protein
MLHEREIDHKASVTDGGAGNAVSSTANAQRELLGPRKFQRGNRVCNGFASQDDGWLTIDHSVPYSARPCILIMMRREKLSVEALLPTIYK